MKLLLTLILALTFVSLKGQLYKCDSTITKFYPDNNIRISGGFKNSVKHWYWEYYPDTAGAHPSITELYWFGELVEKSSPWQVKVNSFSITDTLIEYIFPPILSFLVDKKFKHGTDNYIFCEFSYDCSSDNVLLYFHELTKEKTMNELMKYCLLSNRYILTKNFKIPVVTDYDYKFSAGAVSFTKPDLYLEFDKDLNLIKIEE